MESYTDSFSSGVLMFPDDIMQYVTSKEHPIIFSGIFYYHSRLHRYRNLFRKPDVFAVSFWRISVAPWPEHAFGFGEKIIFSSIHQHINSPIWEWGWLRVKWPLYSHNRKPGCPILLLMSAGRYVLGLCPLGRQCRLLPCPWKCYLARLSAWQLHSGFQVKLCSSNVQWRTAALPNPTWKVLTHAPTLEVWQPLLFFLNYQ